METGDVAGTAGKGDGTLMEARGMVRNPRYIGATVATGFTATASRYSSRIQVGCGQAWADAKSLVGVMWLGARPDTELCIVATGEDAAEAVEALSEYVSTGYPERILTGPVGQGYDGMGR